MNESNLIPPLEQRKNITKTIVKEAKRKIELEKKALLVENLVKKNHMTTVEAIEFIENNEGLASYIQELAQNEVHVDFRKHQKDPLTNLLKKEYLSVRYDMETDLIQERAEDDEVFVAVFF